MRTSLIEIDTDEDWPGGNQCRHNGDAGVRKARDPRRGARVRFALDSRAHRSARRTAWRVTAAGDPRIPRLRGGAGLPGRAHARNETRDWRVAAAATPPTVAGKATGERRRALGRTTHR